MKNIQAWGFLVSRNQYLDYRTVVAPSFMCQAGASSILSKAAEGDLTEKGSALYREIHNSKVGNLTLIFRVIEATAEESGKFATIVRLPPRDFMYRNSVDT